MSRATVKGALLGKGIAVCALLLSASTLAVHAECRCNAACGECVACPAQYETTASCAACYLSTPRLGSVLCRFTGTPAPSASPKLRLLPGTRPYIMIKPETINMPKRPPKPTLPLKAAHALPGTRSSRPASVARNLPGTRPDNIQPAGSVGILPGTRPDNVEQPIPTGILPGTHPDNIHPAGSFGILPGTRPDNIHPAGPTGILPGTRPDNLEPSGSTGEDR
jgi:hypothetical protein